MVTSAGGSCDADATRTPVSILPPRSVEQRGQRVGDRARSAGRDRPAVPVAGGEDAEPDRGGQRPVQRPEGVRRDAAEQRPRLLGAEQPARAPTPGAASGTPNRASAQRVPRDPQQRAA